MSYRIIKGHENYSINRKGDIVDSKYLQHQDVYCADGVHVVINGETIECDRLILTAYVGSIPLPIERCSSGPRYVLDLETEEDDINICGIRFKRIPSCSNYIISEDGIVYSLKRKIFIPFSYNHGGYMTVTITDNAGRRTPKKVHRLVYEAFIGPLTPGMTIDHIDNNRHNNRYTNLQELSYHDNVIKSFEEGASQSYKRWNTPEIIKMCEMLEAGYTNQQIARAVGYNYESDKKTFNHILFRIRHGIAHNDIASQYDFSNYNSALNRKDRVLDDTDVFDIMSALSTGARIIDLANKYKCSTSTISKIRDGVTWKCISSQESKVQRLSKG